MQRRELAAKLISARGRLERQRLLARERAIADSRLARDIKDICYAAWSSEPTKAQRAAAALNELSEVSNDTETQALARWVSGIANITKGKLESAVADLDAANEIFSGIRKRTDGAQTRVAKLIALAMLGRYDEAVRAGKAARAVFVKAGDELAAGKIEMNLSNIFSRRGMHREAEAYCEAALRRFERTGEAEWRTMAENGLANTYAELNDFERSEHFFEKALAGARSAKMTVTEAEIEASMGNLALYRGRYADALRYLETSRQKYERLKMPHQRAVAELEIADIYADMNMPNEACEIYGRVAPALSRLRMRAEEARARANFGRAALSAGNTKQARAQLRRAAELYRAERNPDGSASVKIAEAKLELSAGRAGEARSAAETAAKILAKSENVRLRLAAEFLKAESVRSLGEPVAAEQLLLTVIGDAHRFEQMNIELAALNSLGKTTAANGRPRVAERYFRESIRLIENLRAPLAGEEFRIAFAADKTEPYENLAKLLIADGRIDEAFETIERGRSRVLLESIAANADGGPVMTDELTAVRERLNWIYNRIDRDGGDLRKLLAEARRYEKKIASITRRMQSTLQSAEAADHAFKLGSLRKRLRGRTLVEFVKLDGRYSAFVIDAGGTEFAADLAMSAEVDELLEGLRFQFGSMRMGGDHLTPLIPELKRRADVYLQRLYDKLLRPIRHLLTPPHLTIVPVSSLYYVPFHALHDGDEYVAASHTVSYSPSAAVWERLDKRRRRPANSTLLIGHADDNIPQVGREIDELRRVLPNAVVFDGEDATFSAYAANAGTSDIIHLACHGRFRADDPMFSSLHMADGWITARDIYAQPIRASLVTLSACETGLNKIYGGDEIVGLAGGFLSAGASSLLVTLWTVNDDAAVDVMKAMYAEIAGGKGAAEALRAAQLKFIERGEHPYYWSPFAVIGR